jgi:2-oxo-3-hexenedioate decarboxylase
MGLHRADAVADFGLHGALLLGRWHPIAELEEALATFELDLYRDGVIVDHGHASNVLGGPLTALRHLVDLLARDPVNLPLAADEIVTTGTLTRVPAVAPGEMWSTALTNVALVGIRVQFTRGIQRSSASGRLATPCTVVRTKRQALMAPER